MTELSFTDIGRVDMTRDEIAGVMAMVIDDCATDAAKPVPFTALGVGTIHGEMLAQIAAVARAVELLATHQSLWPITDSIGIRDLLDEFAHDDDVPEFRRNQARQAVADFDRALSGVDAL